MLKLTSVALLVVLALPSSARAYQDADMRPVHRSAWSLDGGEVRLGLGELDAGVTDWLDLGTFVLPWLLVIPNAELRLRLWANDRSALLIGGSVFRVDIERVARLFGDDESQGILWIVPFTAAVSTEVGRNSLSLELIYNQVTDAGQDVALSDFQGALAVTSLQITGSLEHRLTRVTSVWLHGRAVAFQRAEATIVSTTELDERTTAEVHGTVVPEDTTVAAAFGVIPGIRFSWQTTNLLLGVGYGHYTVPGLGFIAPEPTVYPMADLFWRW